MSITDPPVVSSLNGQRGPLTIGSSGGTATITNNGRALNVESNETLGNRLRQAARVAKARNPYLMPPLYALDPWQRSTAYIKGKVIANGGLKFVCYGTGTSASSGNGPSLTSPAGASDNTTGWIYCGQIDTTVDPSYTPPVWTAGATYTAGQIVANGAYLYACIVGGTAASSGGPTGTTLGITDSGVTWNYYGLNKPAPNIPDFPLITFSGSAPSASNNYKFTPFTAVSARNIWVATGGSGYAVNDQITLTGGTFSTAVVGKVTSVASGAITGISLYNAGSYTVLPGATVSQGSTTGSGTGATFVVEWPDPSWCTLRGCYNGGVGSSRWNVYTFQPTVGCTPYMNHGSLEFWSDAQNINFNVSNNADPTMLIVDGRIMRGDGIPATSSTNWCTLDWSTTGGRRNRFYQLEWRQSFQQFLAIAVDSNSSIWAGNNAGRIRVACIADSYFYGSTYHNLVPGGSITKLLGHRLGWNDVWNYSQGGTGYVNRGAGAGTTTDKYSYRIAEAASRNPDLWTLFGSTNDYANYSTFQAAVTSTLTAIRAVSAAPIIVYGFSSINDTGYTTGQKIADFEGLLSTAVSGMADSTIFFIPIRNDPTGPWFTGTWNNTFNTASTNATLYINGTDNVHPDDFGNSYFASRMAEATLAQVYPYLR